MQNSTPEQGSGVTDRTFTHTVKAPRERTGIGPEDTIWDDSDH